MLTTIIKHKLNQNLTLDIFETFNDGTIVAIVGGSGEGKSTLLNLISGLITPNIAHIYDQNQVYENSELNQSCPLHQRRIGYVRQKPYLFPHLNIKSNLLYGVKSVNEEQFYEYLTLFELESHLEKYPSELSGGEAQRVNLVRTLLTNPSLLLLDEPFSALDVRLRQKLGQQLKQLKDLNIPILLVTHDLDEAARLSDEILLLRSGHVIERKPTEVFFTEFESFETAKYLGLKNIDTQAKSVILSQDICFGDTGEAATVVEVVTLPHGVEVSVRLKTKQSILTLFCTHQELNAFKLVQGSHCFIQIKKVKYCL